MRTIILAGTGRSGTTLSADVINASRPFRFIFEPLHKERVPDFSTFRPREYLHPETRSAAFLDPFRRLLGGEIANDWTDRHEIPNAPHGLLIKMVRANLLLGWIHTHFPDTQLILQLRHPLAVADSRVRFNWPVSHKTFTSQKRLMTDHLEPFRETILSAGTDFERHVVAWCIENWLPLVQLPANAFHPLFYERLVREPEQTFATLSTFLGIPFGAAERAVLDRPTETMRPDSQKALERGVDLTTRWRSRLSDEQLEHGMNIVHAFGLGALYGDGDDLPTADTLQQATEEVRALAGKRVSRAASGTAARAPRVLAYAPYAAWQLHGLWEMTLMHGLRVRGAEIGYVLCDGLFSDCDLHWKATAPRTPLSCLQCQAKTASLASTMGMAYSWLGRYITPQQRRQAVEWAEAVPARELADCRFGEWPIGEWMRSSVHSHFRSFELDLAKPEIEQGYRSYVASGLIAAFALETLLDEEQPDILLVLNGRFSSVRVAVEMAVARGIRVVTHERGRTRESIVLNHGPSGDLAPYRKMWQDWGSVPLDEDELREVIGFLEDRRQAKWQAWHAFSPPPGEVEELRTTLQLTAGKRLWAMFLSADDESAANPERNAPFGIQDAWIERSVDYAAAHPELELVIRAHPNIKGKFRGENRRQVALLEALGRRLPPNVRLVMPGDPVSTYTLMEMADAGLVFRSTAGLEMACTGKPVVIAAGGWYTGLPFVTSVREVGEYETLLDQHLALPIGHLSTEIQTGALRFAHAAFFKRNIPFPLVRMDDPHSGAPAYSTLEELLPGRDAGLDRACRIVLEGETVCPPPNAEQQRRSNQAELRLLGGAAEDGADGNGLSQQGGPAKKSTQPGEIMEALELAEKGMTRAAVARLERLRSDPALAEQAGEALRSLMSAGFSEPGEACWL